MLGYFPMDHLAYLVDHKLIPGKSDNMWKYSSRCWFVWTAAELVLLLFAYLSPAKGLSRKVILLRIVRYLCDLAMAYHWSVDRSGFSEAQIAQFGLLGTTVSLYVNWKTQ